MRGPMSLFRLWNTSWWRDSVTTDSARYADMVLPIAQWFELEEVANAGHASPHHSEKAIDPLYESKPDPQS